MVLSLHFLFFSFIFLLFVLVLFSFVFSRSSDLSMNSTWGMELNECGVSIFKNLKKKSRKFLSHHDAVI